MRRLGLYVLTHIDVANNDVGLWALTSYSRVLWYKMYLLRAGYKDIQVDVESEQIENWTEKRKEDAK